MKNYINCFFLGFGLIIGAQTPKSTTSKAVLEGINKFDNLKNESLLKAEKLQNIGPTIMSGRVVDLAVNPKKSTEFYVGYASGGVWYTNNNGTTFTPIMDNAPTQNVGDIAVDWNNNIIWVGTGEKNSSRSSYAGIGILKSTNKGKTWQHIGLEDSHHISRIVINPNNPNHVVVGVIGHLYSKNKERGIFITKDGGLSWKKTWYLNDSVGIIDVVPAPNNFNVMYAAAWERDRKAWHFEGSGVGSGIYKSTDAGETWKKINNGFPEGKGIGRIGLAAYDENTVYVLLDNQFRRTKKQDKNRKTTNHLTKDDLKKMSAEKFLALDSKKLNIFLKENDFQEKYRAENIKQMVKNRHVQPKDIALYLEDANSLLFDTPVVGAEVYKTTNGGANWTKTHENTIEDLYYSYGYYFGEIRVDTQNKDKIYLLGVPIIKSDNGGKTFESISKENVHADHQALWINPNQSGHLIDGNDGGVNMSYDDGENWIKLNQPAVGQFYTVYVDNQEPYNVYGGLQDNGVWTAPSNVKINKAWEQKGKNPYENLMGGDGMQIAVDPKNRNILFTGFQFGNYYKINRKEKKRKYIQPKHKLGERPYRFNWQTPILLSKHDSNVLYLAGNKLHKSKNQGDEWKTISEDLTQGGKKGNVAYGTITTIAESPFNPNRLIVGTDDGLIHYTKNSGKKWKTISTELPQNLWVTRVVASAHKKTRIYTTLNGYRWDNFSPFVYVSENSGKTWKAIHSNLPMGAVNVIKESSENENLLFVGTDNGLYVTFDRGKTWDTFNNKLPHVAVHDLAIQNTAQDLIVGTHGRSLYKMNIAHLNTFTEQMKKEAFHLFQPKPINFNFSWGNSWNKWLPSEVPDYKIRFYSYQFQKGTIQILTKKEEVLFQKELNIQKGFNCFDYSLNIQENAKGFDFNLYKKAKNGLYFLPKGTYKVRLLNKEEIFIVK